MLDARSTDAQSDTLTAACELVGVPHSISKSFALMEIADEEIERAKQEHPEHASTLHRCFLACMPGGLVVFSPEFYRAHVRELLDRAVDGFDLAPGTDAEVLAVLHSGSLRAPLTTQPAALFEMLFARMFPVKHARMFPDALDARPREPWPGASRELANELRRRLTVRERRVADDAPRGSTIATAPARTSARPRRRNAKP